MADDVLTEDSSSVVGAVPPLVVVSNNDDDGDDDDAVTVTLVDDDSSASLDSEVVNGMRAFDRLLLSKQAERTEEKRKRLDEMMGSYHKHLEVLETSVLSDAAGLSEEEFSEIDDITPRGTPRKHSFIGHPFSPFSPFETSFDGGGSARSLGSPLSSRHADTISALMRQMRELEEASKKHEEDLHYSRFQLKSAEEAKEELENQLAEAWVSKDALSSALERCSSMECKLDEVKSLHVTEKVRGDRLDDEVASLRQQLLEAGLRAVVPPSKEDVSLRFQRHIIRLQEELKTEKIRSEELEEHMQLLRDEMNGSLSTNHLGNSAETGRKDGDGVGGVGHQDEEEEDHDDDVALGMKRFDDRLAATPRRADKDAERRARLAAMMSKYSQMGSSSEAVADEYHNDGGAKPSTINGGDDDVAIHGVDDDAVHGALGDDEDDDDASSPPPGSSSEEVVQLRLLVEQLGIHAQEAEDAAQCHLRDAELARARLVRANNESTGLLRRAEEAERGLADATKRVEELEAMLASSKKREADAMESARAAALEERESHQARMDAQRKADTEAAEQRIAEAKKAHAREKEQWMQDLRLEDKQLTGELVKLSKAAHQEANTILAFVETAREDAKSLRDDALRTVAEDAVDRLESAAKTLAEHAMSASKARSFDPEVQQRLMELQSQLGMALRTAVMHLAASSAPLPGGDAGGGAVRDASPSPSLARAEGANGGDGGDLTAAVGSLGESIKVVDAAEAPGGGGGGDGGAGDGDGPFWVAQDGLGFVQAVVSYIDGLLGELKDSTKDDGGRRERLRDGVTRLVGGVKQLAALLSAEAKASRDPSYARKVAEGGSVLNDRATQMKILARINRRADVDEANPVVIGLKGIREHSVELMSTLFTQHLKTRVEEAMKQIHAVEHLLSVYNARKQA